MSKSPIKLLNPTQFEAALDPELPNGYLSPSQVNKYLNCPKNYFFTYVLGNRFRANERMVLGTCTHKLVENAINLKINNNNKTPKIEEVLDSSRSEVENIYFDEDGEPPSLDGDEPLLGLESILDSAQKSFMCWYKDKMPRISPVQSEKLALFSVHGIPIKGYIDYIDLTPEGLRVVDLKVGKKKRDPLDSVQLALYALAESTPLVGYDTILQPTKRLPHRLFESEACLSEAFLNHVSSMVVNVHRGITSGYFPECLPDNWLCKPTWCSNYNDCRGKD